ncbi:uncharacterized protein [Diadema antillarum]|uniref:uncharacterized protein isoform X1 n=1 Tax=Diadema antillarum TaxID=105358 RepID=UPI003A871E64
MPLFGKSKKNDGKKPYPTQGASYPTQQPAYPTQGQYQYPAQPQIAPVQSQQMYAAPPPGAGGYPSAPPPYSATAPPPGPATYNPGYPVAAAPPPRQPQSVLVQGGFDAGARFDGRTPPSIPPPPPGCAPNAAQMASQHGQNVVVTQRPSNWMTGGSDGGYTMW